VKSTPVYANEGKCASVLTRNTQHDWHLCLRLGRFINHD
jgi:hypothetical protein